MIEAGEADRLADMIANATGSGWTIEAIHQLANDITRWKDPAAAYAAADDLARTWVKEWRPPFGVIQRAYKEAEARTTAREAMLAAAERGACDGSGFVAGVPCKRCKPHLRELYREHEPEGGEMWLRWRNGVRIDVLIPDIKERTLPQPCKVDTMHDPTARPVRPKGMPAASVPTPDPERAIAAIRAVGRLHDGRWLAHVTDVNLAFGDEFASVRVSLLAIDPRDLWWGNNGSLALKQVPDVPASPPEPPKAYEPPTVPTDVPSEPGALAAAIAETMKRVTDF